jgi:hypothetical protein
LENCLLPKHLLPGLVHVALRVVEEGELLMPGDESPPFAPCVQPLLLALLPQVIVLHYNVLTTYQGCGSAFISSGSGSDILG